MSAGASITSSTSWAGTLGGVIRVFNWHREDAFLDFELEIVRP
jgi:hypothetical protein